ncbi:MAG: hypothetical protein ABSD74_16010 [Rhizomicrobium sp.]
MQSMRTSGRSSLATPVAMLLGFAPFIAFSLLSNFEKDIALWVAFALAFVIAIRDFAESRLLRLLDVGSVALFGLLSLYAGFLQTEIPLSMVRLVVDGGLFALALGSIALRHPLTIEYAREQVPKEFWFSARFVSTNYVVTGTWTTAFALMAAADIVANKHKLTFGSLEVAVNLVILTIAILLTARYPHYLRTQFARKQGRR